MVGHVVLHAGGGVADTILGADQHGEEIIAGETVVRSPGVRGLELGHALEETQEEGSAVHHRVDPFVTQFTQEASIATVNGLVDDTDVIQGIIEQISVDVVHYFAYGAIRNVQEGTRHEEMTLFVAIA